MLGSLFFVFVDNQLEKQQRELVCRLFDERIFFCCLFFRHVVNTKPPRAVTTLAVLYGSHCLVNKKKSRDLITRYIKTGAL